MCTDPCLLCLDEPAAGLSTHLIRYRCVCAMRSVKFVTNINLALLNMSCLLHNMNVVMDISDHIVVLDYGACIADGTPGEVRNNPAVIRAYLGEPDEAGEGVA